MNKIPIEYSLPVKKWLVRLNPRASVEGVHETNGSDNRFIAIKVHGYLERFEDGELIFKILESCLPRSNVTNSHPSTDQVVLLAPRTTGSKGDCTEAALAYYGW